MKPLFLVAFLSCFIIPSISLSADRSDIFDKFKSISGFGSPVSEVDDIVDDLKNKYKRDKKRMLSLILSNNKFAEILINRCAKGDKIAFEIIYSGYKSKLVKYFKNHSHSEDLAHDVLINVCQSGSYKAKEPFVYYLMKAAKNKQIDHDKFNRKNVSLTEKKSNKQ